MATRGKRSSSNSSVKYTVCGEFFPEPLEILDPKCRSGESPIDTEARLFCACERWAFNRLLEGAFRNDLKTEGQSLFGINSRRVDDAVLKAKTVIDSRRELLPQEIASTEGQLSRAKKKLARAQKDIKKARENNDNEKVERLTRTVRGRKLRVVKLSAKLARLTAHQANGTLPKVVFGGRDLWKRVCRHRVTREDWRAARQNHLYARGDKSKDGNPTIRVSYDSGDFRMAVTVSHLSEAKGVDKLGRPVMSNAPKVNGRLWIPDKHRMRVWELLLSGAEYTVEVTKGTDKRYRTHLSFKVEAAQVCTDPNRGFLGMDTNPDGVGLANIDYNGQPEAWPEDFTVLYPRALHKFDGEFTAVVHPNGFVYLKIPELAYSRGGRRTYLVGVLASVVVGIAKYVGKPLAVENLDFSKGRLDTNRGFNRMASNFPYRAVLDAVARKSSKEGVGLKAVWAAHTSTIGYWKYREKYGVCVHHAAAMVIARRAIGFRERVTKEMTAKVRAFKQSPALEVCYRPREGRGMTLKARLRAFERLDTKMRLHNGLTPFAQTKFYSVWHDLKRLALSSR